MKKFICEATVTSKVTCYVEANSLEDAKDMFKAGDWEDYDDDGGTVQSVDCHLSTVREDA
jgi:hypothetical protein